MTPSCWRPPWTLSSCNGPSRRWSGRSSCVWTWATTSPPERWRWKATTMSRTCVASGWRISIWRLASSISQRVGGWWKGPSHSAYNPLLTSKPLPPMIGRAGLLNLLAVVARLRAVRQDCRHAPQEAGAPCPSSPPDQSIGLAFPPALEGDQAQSLGLLTVSQSATALTSARSSRRTAGRRRRASRREQRGGRA